MFQDEFSGSNEDLDKAWDFQNGPSGHILCSRWRENADVVAGVCLSTHRTSINWQRMACVSQGFSVRPAYACPTAQQ